MPADSRTPMTARLISVVIPTYNRADYLPEAVDSVLAQGYASLELIVVDDGSTDGTKALLAHRGSVRYHYQPNQGIGAARNAGVELARGSYLAFLDSDDVWMPGKLVRQMAVLDADPRVDVVYGHAEQFRSPEIEPGYWQRSRTVPGIVAAPVACSMLIRRAAFDRVGPFDRRLSIGVEMDWYARLAERGLGVRMLPDVLFRRRLHRSNFNLTHASEQSERLRVLKAVIDRRRESAGAR